MHPRFLDQISCPPLEEALATATPWESFSLHQTQEIIRSNWYSKLLGLSSKKEYTFGYSYEFPRSYPFKAIHFSINMDGQSMLEITVRQELTYPLLRRNIIPKGLPMLSDTVTYHDDARHHNDWTDHNRILIFFNMGKDQGVPNDTPDSIRRVFNKVFSKLDYLTPPTTNNDFIYYREARQSILRCLDNYLSKYDAGMLYQDYLLNAREKKALHRNLIERARLQKINEKMNTSIGKVRKMVEHAQYDLLFNALHHGLDPDATDYGIPVLQLAISNNRKDVSFERKLAIIRLLLMYGAKTTFNSVYSEHTAIEQIIEDNNIHKAEEGYETFFLAALRMIFEFERNDARIFVDDTVKDTPLGSTIIAGYRYLAEKNLPPPCIFYACPSPNATLKRITFKMHDGEIIEMQTKRFGDLQQIELINFYKLFSSYAAWRDYFSQGKLLSLFFEILRHCKQDTRVDILHTLSNGEMLAYNLSDTLDFIKDHQLAHIYHILLAASATDQISRYPRLMSIVSYQPAFALKMQHPQRDVLVVYEAATKYSFLQVKDLTFYRKYHCINTWELLVKQSLYANQTVTIHNKLYVPDELSIPTKATVNNPHMLFKTQSEVVKEVFEEYLQVNGFSPVVAFAADMENLLKLCIVMNKNIAYMSFEKIIRLMSLVTTPAPRTYGML